jgi:hypothetical protein
MIKTEKKINWAKLKATDTQEVVEKKPCFN